LTIQTLTSTTSRRAAVAVDKTALLGNKLLMTENNINLAELGTKSEELQGASKVLTKMIFTKVRLPQFLGT